MKKIINQFWKGLWAVLFVGGFVGFIAGCFVGKAEILVDIFVAMKIILSDFQILLGFVIPTLSFFVAVFSILSAYDRLRKDIILKGRLGVYEKTVNGIIEIYGSYFKFANFDNNKEYIKKFDHKEPDDYWGKHIKESESRLIEAMGEFYEKFYKSYEFLGTWKAMFSKDIDYELKFLFDLGWVFYDKASEYQRKLRDLVHLSVKNTPEEVGVLKDELYKLEKEENDLSLYFVNALEKFSLDLGREFFSGFCNESDKKRLFSLEIENTGEGIDLPMLTPRGFELQRVEKSDFQKKFGDGKERLENIKKKIAKMKV